MGPASGGSGGGQAWHSTAYGHWIWHMAQLQQLLTHQGTLAAAPPYAPRAGVLWAQVHTCVCATCMVLAAHLSILGGVGAVRGWSRTGCCRQPEYSSISTLDGSIRANCPSATAALRLVLHHCPASLLPLCTHGVRAHGV